jgi:hypothetical protein
VIHTKRIGAPGVSVLALTIGFTLTISQAAWAASHPSASQGVDPTPVTACGTLSGNNTIYLVTQNINQTGTGDCIVLSGSDDTLDLQGFNVTFTGTGTSKGAGIHITGSEDVIEGFSGTTSRFAEGVLDAGSNTSGDAVNMVSNGIGLEMTSGSSAGTEIWTNFAADSNTKQGVYLNACSDECTISDFDASDNGADGVLVTGSAGPRISVFTATSNGGNGVHVGCVSGCGTNSEVKVGDAPAGISTVPAITGNSGDGVFLDKSESSNKDQIYLINASGNSGIDLFDASSTCGNNHWVHNNYGTAEAAGVSNPSCIPLSPF